MNERMSVKGELRTRIHIKFSFNAFNLLFIDIINVASFGLFSNSNFLLT